MKSVKSYVENVLSPKLQGDGGYIALDFTQEGDQLKIARTLEAGQLSVMVIE